MTNLRERTRAEAFEEIIKAFESQDNKLFRAYEVVELIKTMLAGREGL